MAATVLENGLLVFLNKSVLMFGLHSVWRTLVNVPFATVNRELRTVCD